jgi:hypothetical protein
VITKTVNAAQGSIPIMLANVKVDVESTDGSVSRLLTTTVGVSQTITVTVTDPSFKPITPFVHLTTVGGSASGRALP